MKVSIIVVNYNGKKYLQECLESILNLNFIKKDYEIIVVDNDSSDESERIIKRYNQVKLIRCDKNYGFAKGNNIGIRKSKGDYVVLFNNDLIVDKNWLNQTIPIMDSNKDVGAVGGKIYYRKTSRTWFAGARIYFGAFVTHKYLNNQLGESDYLAGASVMFRKSVLKKTGLFDEKFYLYSEDIDLCKRIKKSGHKIIYNPEAVSYHMVEENRATSHQEYYEQRNRPYLCSKDYYYFKPLYILADLLFLFQLFWIIRVSKNPKKFKFWRETLRARIDSIKMIFGEEIKND